MAIQQIDWNAIEKEAVELLCRYIQINTINPPGNELAGALFLKEVLKKNSIAAELYESDKGRGNLITPLRETVLLFRKSFSSITLMLFRLKKINGSTRRSQEAL